MSASLALRPRELGRGGDRDGRFRPATSIVTSLSSFSKGKETIPAFGISSSKAATTCSTAQERPFRQSHREARLHSVMSLGGPLISASCESDAVDRPRRTAEGTRFARRMIISTNPQAARPGGPYPHVLTHLRWTMTAGSFRSTGHSRWPYPPRPPHVAVDKGIRLVLHLGIRQSFSTRAPIRTRRADTFSRPHVRRSWNTASASDRSLDLDSSSAKLFAKALTFGRLPDSVGGRHLVLSRCVGYWARSGFGGWARRTAPGWALFENQPFVD